jgi:hypothetical protein
VHCLQFISNLHRLRFNINYFFIIISNNNKVITNDGGGGGGGDDKGRNKEYTLL